MHIVRRIALLLAAVTSLAADYNSALADTGPCHSTEFERAEYAICEVDLHKHMVRLFWNRSDGTPDAYLSALPHSLGGGAGMLLFATNAGMFDSNLKPVGLCVEHQVWQGQFSHEADGIFFVSGDRADVAETQAFLKQRLQADLATQSGPMLAIDGRLHPRFERRSTSLKTRNGVGVRADGKVIFVISEKAVSFDAFARLFRDGLKCPNALFLDGGSASSLFAPTLNYPSNIVPLGPMLAVFEKDRGTSQQQ